MLAVPAPLLPRRPLALSDDALHDLVHVVVTREARLGGGIPVLTLLAGGHSTARAARLSTRHLARLGGGLSNAGT